MKIFGVLLLSFWAFAGIATAQDSPSNMHGSWKYLGGYTFIHIDEEQRAFQCRIDRDMNVYFATSQLQDGALEWSSTRFFSIYGSEVDLSGQTWGESGIEFRGRILLLDTLTPERNTSERLELDPVAALPTICLHYLDLSRTSH